MKKEKIKNIFTFCVGIWLYPGEKAQWHFVTVPKKDSKIIKRQYKEFSRGCGSLPVSVTINDTTWYTSIFPDNKTNTYILPLKKEIRRKEGLEVNDKTTVSIEIQV